MKDEDVGICLVTPSYNQGAYLRRTLDSVLNQVVPPSQYVVIDGGSSDESPEIIRDLGDRLSYSVSEADRGMYHAINKGFAKTTAPVMGWLNSDDLHTPWTLRIVRDVFEAFPQVEWLTTTYPLCWDYRGVPTNCYVRPGYCRAAFLAGENLPDAPHGGCGPIQQESTFWRRSLWERAGAHLDESFSLAADFELWARFFEFAELYGVMTPIAGFRVHGNQKTSRQAAEYGKEARRALAQHGGRLASKPASRFIGGFKKWAPASLRRRLAVVQPRPILTYSLSNRRWESSEIWA